MAKHSRSKSALGGKKPKSKPGSSKVPKLVRAAIKSEINKHVHRMHISPTTNGKFLVDHEFKSSPGEPPRDNEQHAVEPADLPTHVGEHLGLGGEMSPAAALPPAPAGPLSSPSSAPSALPGLSPEL